MEKSVLLGAVVYTVLVAIVVIINEAFCKAYCLNKGRQLNALAEDVEMNERGQSVSSRPSTSKPPQRHHNGDELRVHYAYENVQIL